jgi:hypothetical protein
MADPTRQAKIDECVEHICSRGCRTVYRILENLRRGRGVEALQDLNPRERAAVRAELESIMAVYDATSDRGCGT